MAYSYLTEDNVVSRYKSAKQYTEALTDPFPEFERIARNRPHPGIDKAYPKTTDGTTASIVRKSPKRVVQQLPVGVVKHPDGKEDWLTIVAGFIYTNKIIPYANEDYALLQKCWNVIERAETIGGCPTYTPFLEHHGYFCSDLTLPFWGDFFFQNGKKSVRNSNYIFLRSWWQPEDIENLIQREGELSKNARARGEKYESSWNLDALKDIKNKITSKDDKSQTPSEKERQVTTHNGAVEFVTGFQRGVGAKFYTIHSGTEQILRTKVNKDPRGEMPVDMMYFDTDGSNPFGRGVVELVGGLQNLIDSDMQMYQFNRALMLAPPIIKRGNFNKNKIKLAPNVIIDLQNEANASVDAMKIDTTAIAEYPNLYGMQKSQLLNLISSPDTSISSEVGNPGFSKTPEGLKQNQAQVSVDDNYIRKQFETWFESWSETAINLYFAERSGVEEIQLDKETADQIRQLPEFKEELTDRLSDDNKIIIDYDIDTPALKFEVDAATSKLKDDAKQLEGLTTLLDTLEGSPILAQTVPADKVVATWNSIVASSGVENPEDLKIDLDEFKAMQEQAAMQQQAMADEQMAQEQMMGDQMQAPPMELPAETSPELADAMQSAQQTEGTEDDQLIMILQQLGASPEQQQQALQMLYDGATDVEILRMLVGGLNGQA